MRPNEFGSDDRDQGERSGVVPVGPVVPVRAPRALPLVLIVAVLVGTAAFVAGLQLGAARPADTTRPDAAPSAAASVVLAAAPSPSTEAPPTEVTSEVSTPGPPYASVFATTFEPPALFAGFVGGKGCVSHIEQTEEAIGIIEYILVRSWTTFCPLQAEGRLGFVTDLSQAIAQEVPLTNGWTLSTEDDGSILAVYPYTDSGFIGTVTMSADNAGSGFEIVISLQERRAP